MRVLSLSENRRVLGFRVVEIVNEKLVLNDLRGLDRVLLIRLFRFERLKLLSAAGLQKDGCSGVRLHLFGS